MHALFRHRRNGGQTEVYEYRSPSSTSVRILHGEEELREAVERASGFEQFLMNQASARASRYLRLTPADRTAEHVEVSTAHHDAPGAHERA